MKLWWYSAANILYILGSLGYLGVNIANLINRDTVESLATYIILVILAIVFVIDALLYTADWIEQRQNKTRRDLISCILNIIGSILYLIGATVFKNQKTSTNALSNFDNIPSFIFNIIGMLAFLAESILNFFTPPVSKTQSICSVEFFARLLNLFGNITYLIAHVVQPIISFVSSFTTEYLTKITDMVFLIIRPIQIFGDTIYTIDALLYMIVWLKANEHLRKIGNVWIEKSKTAMNKIVSNKSSMDNEIRNDELKFETSPVETVSKSTHEQIVEDVESSIKIQN